MSDTHTHHHCPNMMYYTIKYLQKIFFKYKIQKFIPEINEECLFAAL